MKAARREPWVGRQKAASPDRGERNPLVNVCRPLRGLGWNLLSHGSRRGLPSAAAPQLEEKMHIPRRRILFAEGVRLSEK